MLQKLQDLYNTHGTIYRLYWTLLQVGAGAAVAYATDKPELALPVALLAAVITSEARKHLKGLDDPR